MRRMTDLSADVKSVLLKILEACAFRAIGRVVGSQQIVWQFPESFFNKKETIALSEYLDIAYSRMIGYDATANRIRICSGRNAERIEKNFIATLQSVCEADNDDEPVLDDAAQHVLTAAMHRSSVVSVIFGHAEQYDFSECDFVTGSIQNLPGSNPPLFQYSYFTETYPSSGFFSGVVHQNPFIGADTGCDEVREYMKKMH